VVGRYEYWWRAMVRDDGCLGGGGHATLTCDAKVTVARNQKISRFEVAMYYVMIVEVGDPSQQLIHKIPVVRVRKRLRRLDDAMQVRVQELHHNV